MGRSGSDFCCHRVSAVGSWNHAKKKDSEEAGGVEFGGQSAPASNHEEGPRDQASEGVNRDIRYLALTNEFLEVVLKNQCDILEQLVRMSKSLAILSEWAEKNWSAKGVRGPNE
jgi:hypothetical protein